MSIDGCAATRALGRGGYRRVRINALCGYLGPVAATFLAAAPLRPRQTSPHGLGRDRLTNWSCPQVSSRETCGERERLTGVFSAHTGTMVPWTTGRSNRSMTAVGRTDTFSPAHRVAVLSAGSARDGDFSRPNLPRDDLDGAEGTAADVLEPVLGRPRTYFDQAWATPELRMRARPRSGSANKSRRLRGCVACTPRWREMTPRRPRRRAPARNCWLTSRWPAKTPMVNSPFWMTETWWFCPTRCSSGVTHGRFPCQRR